MKSCENCRYRAIDENALPCCACIELGPDLSGWVGLTNADRIRAMTDEGIEDWYWWMHKEMMWYADSRIFVHDWLKSPVEVEE